MVHFAELFLGLAILTLAADLLVRGAVGLANILRIPHLIVGLTVVAFGTSAPELVVSLQAALRGAGGIAVGNVVGSNIANVLIVLGMPSVLRATMCNGAGTSRNLVFMLVITVVFMWLCADGELTRLDGAIMLGLFALFFVDQFVSTRRAQRAGLPVDLELEEATGAPEGAGMASLMTLVGLISLPFAAHGVVEGAIGVAGIFGVSETAIGVTVVALGTSLPELAAAVASAVRGHSAVTVGNAIGSNVFNILGIMGITAAVVPIAVPMEFFHLEMWVMLAASLLLVPFVLLSWPIGRLAGALMAVSYVAIMYVILAGT
jgi:cation:H+ antiporter